MIRLPARLIFDSAWSGGFSLASAETRTLKRALYGEMQIALVPHEPARGHELGPARIRLSRDLEKLRVVGLCLGAIAGQLR